jgi:carbon storage regulator
MLVITTQEGEAIQIGEDVRILVRRVKGGWVRLCIDAPREVPIQRIEAPPEVEVAKRPKRVGEGT